jgi:DNA repair protein RadD
MPSKWFGPDALAGATGAGIKLREPNSLVSNPASPSLQAPSSGSVAALTRAGPELRPYQREVIGRFNGEVAAGRRRVLLVAPTGSGKTVIASATVADAASNGRQVLFLAHRRELIQQASRKLYAVGIGHGIVQASFPTRPGERVQVASISTLDARAIRTRTMDLPAADLVVVDEAHHAPARTYRRLLAAYPEAVILGLTATPCRSDGRGLGNVFERMIETVDIPALITDRYLVPVQTYAPSSPDLRGIHVRQGDYVASELEAAVNTVQLVGDIPENWLRLARGRPTTVFCTSVKHSIHIRDRFREAGIMAEHLDGETPNGERDALLVKLASGEIEVLTNCATLIEGWDCPPVSCVVIARPTKSLGLFRQMAGRGLRPALGKENLLLLDHAGATFEHGLITDPILWSLREDRKAVNREQSARAAGYKPRLASCPECSAVRLEGKPCEICGWRPRTRGESFDVIEGDLARVDANGTTRASAASPAEKQLFFQELAYIAQEVGHKPGAAFYRFQEKFKGEKPPYHWRNLSPLPPRPETRAWYRSRQIAYAKARQKAGSQWRSA